MEVYVAATALGVLAVAVLLAAAMRSGRARDPDTLPALFSDRRKELAAEAGAQGLDPAETSALEEELALNHLDEAGRVASQGQGPGKRTPFLPLLGGAALALVAALVLYGQWGEPDAPVLARAQEIMRTADPVAMSRLEDALESRLARTPEDVNAWFLLGHLRMQTEDYGGAAQAFAALSDVAGPVAEVDFAWAQASYRADGGEMSAATRVIVDRVLAARPDDSSMLELLAMDAIHRRDFAAATRHLARVLDQSMPASRRALLTETLAHVEGRLPKGAEVDTTTDFPVGTGGIAVSVSLDATFEAGAAAQVFVIARNPAAPRPPLAVRRLTVGDLPANIELTDADAMIPGRSLADLDEVQLLARVSLGGSPSARSGDLESGLTTTSAGGDRVSLHIDRRVP